MPIAVTPARVPGQEPPPQWRAAWIWFPGARNAVNFHFHARRVVPLSAPPLRACLRISAYTDYLLMVNGRYVARGPLPSEPSRPSYDTHDVTALLNPGANAIAVVCHNFGVGLHWHHKGPGALLAQLDVDTEAGRVVAGTDANWRVRRAECYRPDAPRMFWSAGFMEFFDFHHDDTSWTSADYDDAGWEAPEVVAPAAGDPNRALEAREIPLLRETFHASVAAEQGRYAVPALHAIHFAPVLPSGRTGLVYAQTCFRCDHERRAVLRVACDDAFRVRIEGQVVLEQTYSEQFARTRVWRGLDEYDQVHYGMSGLHRPPEAPIRLAAGWNRLDMAVDQGEIGWGFLLGLLDPGAGLVLDLPFAADEASPGRWRIAGPHPSSGLADSLDGAAACFEEAGPELRTEVDPFARDTVTDVASLMAAERRTDWAPTQAGDGAALQVGEFLVVDLGAVRVGHPLLHIEAADDAVLDVAYSNYLPEDRRLTLYQGGVLRCADRVCARPGAQTWQPLHRRNGRYMHISCRKGTSVRLSGLGMRSVGYPVENLAAFDCSDPALVRIWEASRATTALLMQYGYQDCLRREQSTLNHQSHNYASRAAACCFGDTLLARRALRQAIATQHDDGWFDSHGQSSPNSDDVTQCFSWSVFLEDYLLYSGDQAFVAEVFPRLEDNLRFFSKMTNHHGLIDGRNIHVYRPGQLAYIDDACSYREEDGYTTLPIRQSEIFGFSLFFCAALAAAGRLALRLGLAERADYWQRRAERVRHACNQRFWDPERRLFAEWIADGQRSQRAHPIMQLMALYFEVGDAAQRRELLEHVVKTLGQPTEDHWPLTTFNVYYYFLEVLFREGQDRIAVELLRRVFGGWLDAGADVFAEWFCPGQNVRNGRIAEEYEVHGYGAAAHLHFYRHILRIVPLEPGFRRVRIAPTPGGLSWATAKSWRGDLAKAGWRDRGADGTHPWDPFAGGPGVKFIGEETNRTYLGAGRGRLVFGCVLEDAAVANDEVDLGFGPEAYHMMKFGPRLGVFGSRVCVANNLVPPSQHNFIYTQWIRSSRFIGKNRWKWTDPVVGAVQWDYGRACGVDINKDLVGQVGGGYWEKGVVVRDNWVFNHGHKGYNVSGAWVVIRNNRGERKFLGSGDDVYGLGGNWKLTLDGWRLCSGGSGDASDNLSRAFDLCGRNLWVDGNSYCALGSQPGNDGEGILCQVHGGTDLFSWAVTHNQNPKDGHHTGYMGGYNVKTYGFLGAWNKTPGAVGILASGNNTMLDVAIVANQSEAGPEPKQPGPQQDVLTTSSPALPAAPKDVKAEVAEGDHVLLTWADASQDEVGFRVERKIEDGPWTAIAYRPRHGKGTPENPQAWADFLAPTGRKLSYRVVAINADDKGGASASTAPLVIPR